VRNFVAVSGANHGVWTATPDARGPNRISSLELAIGSPWLEQLNRGGETPGPMRTMTLYDGTGRYDVLFPPPQQDSPALAGATNLAFDREAGFFDGGYGHLELPRSRAGIKAMLDFIKQASEPLPQAIPPKLLREGDVVHADSPDALLHCSLDGHYPDASTPSQLRVTLPPGAVATCYTHSARTGLASPMSRFLARSPRKPGTAPLLLTADHASGPYENPVSVKLTANDPSAMIVYTTAGGSQGVVPGTGDALYRAPIYIAAPLHLSAIAIAADGRRSAPLQRDYDISLQFIDANHTLERSVDLAAPLRFDASNNTGN
jgi:hypothetical protein